MDPHRLLTGHVGTFLLKTQTSAEVPTATRTEPSWRTPPPTSARPLGGPAPFPFAPRVRRKRLPRLQGIADPDTMQEEWFAQASALRVVENGAVGYSLVEPVRTIVDETVTYTFTGLNFHGGRQIYAKISYMSTTCAGNAPGTPAAGVLVQNGTAQFTVTEASVYKVCVQERAPFWFPLADLWVRTVVDANPPRPAPYPPFAGFQTCAGYLQHYTGRCGCFYGDGATAFTTLDEQDGVNLLLGTVPQNQTLNQGCCAMSADRHVVKTTHPKWGYCTKVTN